MSCSNRLNVRDSRAVNCAASAIDGVSLRSSWRVLASRSILFFAFCLSAHSAAAEAIVVEAAPGSCPAASAVTIRLAGIVGEELLTPAPGAPVHRVLVEDRGERWSVRIDGRSRQFLDPAHRCDDRARAAAVFAAVALGFRAEPTVPVPPPTPATEAPPTPLRSPEPALPPPVASGPPTVSPAPAPEVPPLPRIASPPSVRSAEEKTSQPVSRSDSRLSVRSELNLALGFGVGTASNGSAVALGGAGRFVLGRRWDTWRIEGIVDVGGLGPTTINYGSADAIVTLVALGLGARITRMGTIEIGAELAAVPLLAHVVGANVPMPHDEWHGEFGLRGAATFSGPSAWRVAPLVRFETLWVVDAHDVAVIPTGIAGQLPSAWVSLIVGIALRLR